MADITKHVRARFFSAMQNEPILTPLRASRTVIAAFSGGADSAALLSLLRDCVPTWGKRLLAVHVHHGIRGAEADRDEAFCRDFCRTRGIDIEIFHFDVPAYAAEKKLGVEEAARQLRYRALTEVAQREGGCIATAHSADDNLETVLHHMLRGTGLDGLCGIPPCRDSIIRPLLTVSAADIRAFCRAATIPYVTDSTNADTDYTRNYIRQTVVPALREIVPAPEASLARMCTLLRTDAAYLRDAATASLGEYADKTAAPLSLLCGLPESLATRAYARLYRNASPEEQSLSYVHIRDIAKLVQNGHGRICLPGDICARVHRGMLSFHARAEIERAADPDFVCTLADGVKNFPEYGFSVYMGEENPRNFPLGENIYKLSICTSFPFATIQGSVYVRFRRSGDKIVSGGMTHSVKKLLAESGLPPETRARLPIFCDDGGILWIPGVRRRDVSFATEGKIRYLACFSWADA